MTSCDLPRIQISDPGELIETVPYLLGFHPRESLVLIGFAGGADPTGSVDSSGTVDSSGPQQIQVTIRVDLPDQLPGSLDAQAMQPLSEVLRRAESAAMAAVLVTDSVRGDPRQSGALLACRDLLAACMDESGIEVLDVLVATERRWWSLWCEQPECCPSDGHERVLGSSAAAQATFAGLVALPDRQAMVATLAGGSAEQRSAPLPQLAEAQRRRTGILPEQAAGWRRAAVADLLAAAAEYAAAVELAAGGERASGGERAATAALTREQLARYAVALTDLEVRDALWLALDDGCAPISQLMSELHARVPAPYDAAPLFLFGWSQWRAGNATLAMMAAERVLESQPGYSAAALLLTAAQRGLDPRTVPALSQGRPG
jgi:hypothetical protein